MIWVLVFGGIALAGLVMLVGYGIWLAHLGSDVMSELGVVTDRLDRLGSLAAQIQFPAPGSGADPGYGWSTSTSGVGSEHRTYDNEDVTLGRVGKEE